MKPSSIAATSGKRRGVVALMGMLAAFYGLSLWFGLGGAGPVWAVVLPKLAA